MKPISTIYKSSDKGKDVIQLFKGNQSTRAMEMVKQVEIPKAQKKVYLKIDSNKDNYSFSYALAKDKWTLLQDKLDGKYLSTQTAGGFVGCLYSLYATSSGEPSENKAVFRWLDYSGNDKTFE